jgi:TatD DNase family protein
MFRGMWSGTFFDTHCHLDFPDYDGDREEVIRRAEEAGITRLVAIGTDLASSRRAIGLAAAHSSVYAAVGWHPGHVSEAPRNLRTHLVELARQPKVVAIGEIGLDYYRLPEGSDEAAERERAAIRQRQAEVFREQLEVAAELGLNCVIHQRDSFEDVLEQLRPFQGRLRGVLHCFVNGVADLRRVLDAGHMVSFTGIVTFKNAALIRESVAAVPDDRFMLETDAPFLAPVPFRGKRCEPAHVRQIAECVAGVRSCGLDELSRATSANALEFFKGLQG